jgi:DNA replication ATP-dependent helicase Dna2
MNVSLFKRLAEAHPEAVVCLNSQYRMNEEVMLLSNLLIYDNRLVCGNAEVAMGRIFLPSHDALLEEMNHSALVCRKSRLEKHVPFCLSLEPTPWNASGLLWLRRCVNPENCVVFLDTDSVKPRTSLEFPVAHTSMTNEEVSLLSDADMSLSVTGSGGRGIINPLEILIVKLLLDSFEFCGVNMSAVGVVTPYRAQVRHLENALRGGENIWTTHEGSPAPRSFPVVSTVDKFQGRDMDIIIISTVRCNAQRSVSADLPMSRPSLLVIIFFLG